MFKDYKSCISENSFVPKPFLIQAATAGESNKIFRESQTKTSVVVVWSVRWWKSAVSYVGFIHYINSHSLFVSFIGLSNSCQCFLIQMATDDITSEPGKILLIPVDGSGNSWNAFNCKCFWCSFIFSYKFHTYSTDERI